MKFVLTGTIKSWYMYYHSSSPMQSLYGPGIHGITVLIIILIFKKTQFAEKKDTPYLQDPCRFDLSG